MLHGELESFRTRLAYRLDRFLRYRGGAQLVILITVTFGVVLAYALLLRLTGGPAEGAGVWENLWWSLGRFSDGGTMYSDQGPRLRLIAVAITWTGVFLVQFMTGAVTAKLADRLGQVRSGRSPVVERGHVLVLGFDGKVPLIARELARSHQKAVFVVLADRDIKDLDARLAVAERIPGNRIRVETRTGNPQDEFTLLRMAADRARTIIIVPPEELTDSAASRWVLITLLAVRRACGARFAGHVIVESRHAGKEALLRAAAEALPGSPTSEPLRLIPIASDDILSRVLAQSVRQTGVFFVLRELLGFRGTELYVVRVPRSLAGKTFGEIHAAITGGIVIGVQPKGRLPCVNPPDSLVVRGKDNLIVLQEDAGSFRVGSARTLTAPESYVPAGTPCGEDAPMAVVVLGDNGALPEFMAELASSLPKGSRIRLVTQHLPEGVTPTTFTAHTVELTCEQDDPVRVARNPPAFIVEADAVVVLGTATEDDLEADAVALETLVWLRHAKRKHNIHVRRVVTELRDLGSATHMEGTPDDFFVSSELVGMLMAQLTVEPRLETALYKDILDAGGNDVFVHPRSVYVGDGPATFEQVMKGARLRGEVALGLMHSTVAGTSMDLRRLVEGKAEEDDISPAELVPSRDATVAEDVQVVVLGRG